MADYGAIGTYPKDISSVNPLFTVLDTEGIYVPIFQAEIANQSLKVLGVDLTGILYKAELYTMPPVTLLGMLVTSKVQKLAVWAYSDSILLDTHGYIAGIVIRNGVPEPNCVVRLYYKTNGFLIESTKTNSLGEFRFDYLEVGQPLYTVIAFLDTYQAEVYDALVPVRA